MQRQRSDYQRGFIGSLLVFVIVVMFIFWAFTNYIVPQMNDKCKAVYGNDWRVVFHGDFLCEDKNGDLKSVR